LALGARLLARRVACCGTCRACDTPPVPSALPPGVGRSRGFLNVGVLRQGASRFAMSFMRVPTRTSTLKSSPRSPPNLGGSAERSEARGACSRILQNRHKEQNANHAPDAKSAPLPNEVRHRGAADDRQGGPRGAHSAKPTQRAKRQPRTQRQVCPLSREASDGGQKTRRLTHAMAPKPNLENGGS